MNSRLFSLTVYFFVISILLTGCRSCGDSAEFYFSQQFRENIMFNPGSYWVYEDTTLGLKDSIYLLSSKISMNKLSAESRDKEEVLEQHFMVSDGQNTQEMLAFSQATAGQFNYPNVWGFYSDKYQKDNPNIYSKLDSLAVNNIIYYDVNVFEIQDERYYWCAHVGLIQKEMFVDQMNSVLARYCLIAHHIE